ncbi:hypothetical protein ABMA28_011638 [Loxostege sticticalis]|uniref:Uncharacterized protein n=1 Tax=Loxostege sticticalis TaxID=481309 RepID=A0ABD0S837_LOXSC
MGPLKSEYLSYLPWCFVCFSAGRRARRPRHASCLGALGAAHAHAVSPALAAGTARALSDARVDPRLVRGALVWCCGGPCVWLSLSASRDSGAALAALAGSYIASLVAVPVAMFVICGRAPVPALGPPLWSALCTLPPLAAGALYSYLQRSHDRVQTLNEPPQSGGEGRIVKLQCPRLAERLSALALLYVDCCERLREAEGSLYVGDVLTTLVLAVWCVSVRALCVQAYARCGLPAQHVHTLTLCVVPKALNTGWETSIDCVPAGLARLPAVFLAPAQALLVAALAEYEDCEVLERDEYEVLPYHR